MAAPRKRMFTPEDQEAKEHRFIEIIALGGTLSTAAKEFKCSTALLCKWLADPEKNELRDRYVRARENQADAFADEILDVARNKNLDPQQARLQVDALKWAAGKRKPKVYGDRVQQEISGPDGGPIEHKVESPLDVLDARLSALASRIGAPGSGPKPDGGTS